mgnify:CR=1 FL=1
MTFVPLPDQQPRRLSFYLALEEYLARHRNDGDEDLFLMWQVGPSVIFGRNQLIENEVNVDYCRAHGIATYRRKSGGGCVYADMGNVMLAYITRSDNVQFTYHRYIQLLLLVLREMGVEATTSGRNDVLIDGRKVSGNAFYHIPGHAIVHGTLLYDTTMENMVGAITPSTAKLESKGVDSVRQRIALLKDYTTLSLAEVMAAIRRRLCDRELLLTATDVDAIELLERDYLDDEFVYGRNPSYSVIRSGRIEGVGDLEVRLEVKNDVIRSANIMGDFFVVGDIDGQLLHPLRGCPLKAQALRAALPPELTGVILNLHTEDLINILTEND